MCIAFAFMDVVCSGGSVFKVIQCGSVNRHKAKENKDV